MNEYFIVGSLIVAVLATALPLIVWLDREDTRR
ncbi:hypothetical protein SAMN05421671_3101 [Pimelobacter simplex]|nr:hypothetical protein SAMN05421671_3101 [Pimelobacter simplex]